MQIILLCDRHMVTVTWSQSQAERNYGWETGNIYHNFRVANMSHAMNIELVIN